MSFASLSDAHLIGIGVEIDAFAGKNRERVQTLTKWKPKRRQACAKTMQHEIQNVDYTLNEYQFIISTQFSTKNP